MWWPSVLRRLRVFIPGSPYTRILESYLSDRSIYFSQGGKCFSRIVNRGCPQGSVLGPFLWNLLLDELLLELSVMPGLSLAYADDLAILVRAGSRKELEASLEQYASKIEEWLSENKLALSLRKTHAVLLEGKLSKSRPPIVRLSGGNLRWTDRTVYLGIHLDTGLTFIPHIIYLRDKVNSLNMKFRRLCCGTGEDGRRMMRMYYKAIYLPVVLYCSSVWISRVTNKLFVRHLSACHRSVLLMLAPVCRTVATAALEVLTGTIPLQHMAGITTGKFYFRRGMEYKVQDRVFTPLDVNSPTFKQSINSYKTELESLMLTAWQNDWNSCDTGRNTFSWIPKADFAIKAKYFRPDYYLTCIITGHGPFRDTLCRLNLESDPRCTCGALETSDHIFFECNRYTVHRPVGLAGYISDHRGLIGSLATYRQTMSVAKLILQQIYLERNSNSSE